MEPPQICLIDYGLSHKLTEQETNVVTTDMQGNIHFLAKSQITNKRMLFLVITYVGNRVFTSDRFGIFGVYNSVSDEG